MLEDYTKYGLRIRFVQDEDAPNPRKDFDNFGEMVCFHSRYDLGDKHHRETPEEFLQSLAEEYREGFVSYWDNEAYDRICKSKWDSEERKEEEKTWKESYRRALWGIINKNYLILPLYLYDHSGITMNTGGFSCPWDSGQVGWIYVSKETVKKEYGVNRITKKIREKALALLESEVKSYDAYLTGSVYGFIVETVELDEDGEPLGEEGEQLDSCWGFLVADDEDEKYLREQAESSAKYQSELLTKQQALTFAADHTQELLTV